MPDSPTPPTDAPPASAPAQDAYAAWRIPDYRRFMLGTTLAFTGGGMQATALGWELYERTHEEFYLGLVGLVQAAPVAGLALPAGHLVDRLNHQRVLVAALSVSVLSSLGLAWLSHTEGSLVLVYVCLFLLGVVRAFSSPAASALLPSIVPRGLLANAVSWRLTGFQIAQFTGPALAGFALAWLTSPKWIYAVCALATFVYLLLLTGLAPRKTERSAEPPGFGAVLAGVRFLWSQPVLLAAITLDLFAVLLGGATALLPVYAKDILDAGPQGFGYLRAAPAIGAILTTLIMAHRGGIEHAGRTLMAAVAVFGAATVVFGLSRVFYLSFAMLLIIGAADAVSVVIRHTLLQLRTPDAMRGRVAAVNGVFISASNELGAFESGTVAAFFGPVFSVVSGGVGTLLVVAGTALACPSLRRLKRVDENPD